MRRALLALLLGLAATIAQAGEPGTIIKDVPLRATPAGSGASVADLKADTPVEVVENRRWWLRVSAGGREGWVPVFYVRTAAMQSSKDAGKEVAGVLGLATGRQGSGQVTSTIGIRGLSEEELKTAHFDAQELRRAEGYAVNAEDAARFAAQGGLKSRDVPRLAGEVPSSRPASGAGGNPFSQ